MLFFCTRVCWIWRKGLFLFSWIDFKKQPFCLFLIACFGLRVHVFYCFLVIFVFYSLVYLCGVFFVYLCSLIVWCWFYTFVCFRGYVLHIFLLVYISRFCKILCSFFYCFINFNFFCKSSQIVILWLFMYFIFVFFFNWFEFLGAYFVFLCN